MARHWAACDERLDLLLAQPIVRATSFGTVVRLVERPDYAHVTAFA